MTAFSFADATNWQCAACHCPLTSREVKVTYLASVFTVELMACPQCGFILVPEHLACGKMLEVEQLLEDK